MNITKSNRSNKRIHLLAAILPSTYFWTVGSYFALIKGFQLIEYAKKHSLLSGFLGTTYWGDLLIGICYAIPPLITVGLVGELIDKRPNMVGKITFWCILGSALSLFAFLIFLKILNPFFTLLLVVVLLTCLAGLATASNTIYGAVTPWKYRGRGFAIGNAIFGASVIILLVVSGLLEWDFYLSLLFLSLTGFILALFFYQVTKTWTYWENDDWPTASIQILGRNSVRSYFFSHVLIYFMLGLTIGSLAQEGVSEGYTKLLNIELGAFETFWAILIAGTVCFVLPAGFLADRWGRKTLTILATYGIVLASLIASLHGLIDSNFDFLLYILTAFTIGVAFAFLHPTLDSSIWVDLASKDSIGRYCDINVYSLITGLASGFAISYFFLTELTEHRNIMVLIYIGLAVIAVLPLFWVSDSYPPLEFFLLLVINEGGMPIFHYSFGQKSLKIDLPLISGALSAVGSFMLEATGEEDAKLNLVRHGSHFILSDQKTNKENGVKLTATIFSNKNDPELQVILSKFLRRFVKKHSKTLKTWKGDINAFKDAIGDAEELFGPLITISRDEQLIEFS